MEQDIEKKNNENICTELNNDKSESILSILDVGVSKNYLDDSLTFIWGNAAFYREFGYGEKEFQFRFPDMKKYGKIKSQDFEPMIRHFHQAFKNGEKSAEYLVYMPINHKEPVWLKMTATFVEAKENKLPVVYILYSNINEMVLEQNELSLKVNERKENLEWMMSEYTGNVYISDMDTYELLYLNKNACDTLGVPGGKFIGKKCYEVIQGRETPCPFCTNSRLKKNETYEWEFYNHKLERTFMIKDRMLEWEGHKARIELSCDTYSAEYKLAKKDQEREAILKTIPAGMVRIDAEDHHKVLWCNDIFLNMLEYTKEQFEQELHNRCAYMHPDDFKRASFMAREMNKTGENVVFEVRAYTRSKEERIWTVTLCYISGEDSWDGISSLYSIGLDITKERRKIEKLQYKVEKDALTGILNRAEAERQIKEYLTANPDEMSALFMIDTDNFKWINDTKGHLVGDMVLAEMAAGMKNSMRENDVVGRIGGDEFTIFMKNIRSPEDAEKKGNELLSMFRHLFEKEKNPVSVTCSIGASIYPRDGKTFKELYAKADRALYHAKSQGKDNYVSYNNIVLKNINSNNYVSCRTEIESEKVSEEGSDSPTRYVFRVLYQSADLDKAMNDILEIVGKQYNVSRAYVFENSEDGRFTSNTYEWCNEGITSEIANLQNCDYSDYGEYEKLFGEDSIFYCRDVHTLKPEQEALFAEQGVFSTLQCALWDDDVFCGFIGFDECTGLRLWTQEEVNMLSLISQILSIFLQRKRTKKVKQEMQQYQAVLNRLNDCIYVIEEKNEILLYKNSKFSQLYPDYVLGDRFHSDSKDFHKMPIVWDQKVAFLCVHY